MHILTLQLYSEYYTLNAINLNNNNSCYFQYIHWPDALYPLRLFFSTVSSGATLSAGPLQSVSCKHPIRSLHYRPEQWKRDERAKPTQTHCTVHHCESWNSTMNLVLLIDHCHFLHCHLITHSFIFAPVIFWQWDVHKIYFTCSVSLKKLKKANFFNTYWAFSIIQHLWHKNEHDTLLIKMPGWKAH